LNARNIKVAHVFGRDNKEKKRRKLGFWMGDARIKASTVHSFKGWESRAMVVLVDKADTVAERLAIYVALSRLKHSPAGSFLSVVCSAPELEEYGRSWPDFSKR
jgi:cellulose synthase/poly-beta-1,6-N-acetylglucosamine synthase-like glycosyltransferase